jgi:NitT/TauT family transport system permease protein
LPTPGELKARPNRTLVGGALGVLALVAAWSVLGANQPEIILPSPAQTYRALKELLASGALFTSLGLTFYRAAGGVLLALGLGVVWGAVNGVSDWASAVSRPLVSALMAIPPVVLVSLGLIWLGPGPGVTRLVIVLVALPLIVVTVEEAVRDLDKSLIEMAQAFRLPRLSRLLHVVAPGVASPVLAATTVTFGQSLRVAIMAELLSATTGIGARIQQAQANLDTAKIFAWTITVVLAVILLEALVLKPLNNRLLRWRQVPELGEAH